MSAPDPMAVAIARRHERLTRLITPLPGSEPRDHFRPVNIPAACDGRRLLEALCHIVRHMSAAEWQARCERGFVLDADGSPVDGDRIVRTGEQYRHKFPAVIEPDVNMRVEVLHEDEALVVVNKPAPLPMHAGGRFHRNTLQYVLDALYEPDKLRPSHRLDANTTGVLVAARTRAAAAHVQRQFARGEVDKLYLARVQGWPSAEQFECEARISVQAGKIGSRTIDEQAGLSARTEFRVARRHEDGTTVLEARPRTGRTNQIRVHLWHLGFPVCGDAAYLSGNVLGEHQTLSLDAPPLCLHAWRVAFEHPAHNEQVTFSAPLPAWAAAST